MGKPPTENTPPENTDSTTGAAADETAGEKISVRITGALTVHTTEASKGQTLGDVLKALGLQKPENYNYRMGSQPVALSRALNDSIELTAVEKAAQS